MPKRRLVTIGLALALTGCSFVPELERPQPPVPAAWPEQARAADTGVAAARITWQEFFADPRLRSLIGLTLENSRDLRMAVARVEQARALYGIVRADRLPNLDITASRSETHTPADLSASGQETRSRRYDVGLGLLAFEVDLWGRVAALSEAARAGFLASEETARAVRVSLVAEALNAYLTSLELAERIRATEATVLNREAARRLFARRVELGIASQVELLAAEGALQTARADLAALRRQWAAAENALFVLVGAPLPDALMADSLAEIVIGDEFAAGVPSTTLLERPDVRAAEQRLISANADIGAARAAFFPRISLLGSFGSASRELDGLFDSGSKAWNFTPQLRLPLFDAGRNAANLDLTEARKVEAVADYELTIQQAFREAADTLVARIELRDQLGALEAGRAAQQERLALVQKRFDAGAASYLEVLDAQRELYAVEQNEIQVRRQRLGNAVQTFRALGGVIDPDPAA